MVIFRDIIMYVAIALLAVTIAQFRGVVLKWRTLDEVLKDKKTIICGISGIALLILYRFLFTLSFQ